MADGDRGPMFKFQYLQGKKFPSLEDKENIEVLEKWSLKGNIKAQIFGFDQLFQPYQKDKFVEDFFQDPNVLGALQVCTSSGKWMPLGQKAEKVHVEAVPCTQMSMGFFDRLYDNDIVRESGLIRKCFDEFFEDFTISDELRKLLLLEDSDNYCIFAESEREQFLFRLFQHVCLGGQVCQYEDSVEPYLDYTKKLYKDLISVQKNAETKELSIVSSVFKVTASTDQGMIYPTDRDHRQDFAYLIVDPLKRHVIVLCHRFGSATF